jgi:hypothetical protein
MNRDGDIKSFAPVRSELLVCAKGGAQGRDAVSSNMESPIDVRIREVEIETAVLRRFMARHSGRFLKGPIPMGEIGLAARLPGRALALLLAVHHQTALTGKALVTLPRSLLVMLGIGKDAKARALRELEQAGLVTVERATGRAARVRLRAPPNEPTPAAAYPVDAHHSVAAANTARNHLS